MKDYYKILGVSDAAEIEVITASYRAMMRKYHPDTNPSPSSGEKAKEINEAYEVLRDAEKRRDYDQQRQASKGGQSQEQERARQERERERKEQADRQKREQDAQAREQQERERQERVKREREQQERESQERAKREREQQQRETQERVKREREQQEREARTKNSSSAETNNANQTDADKFSKKIDGSHILIFGALVIGALLIMGYLVTEPSPGEQSSAEFAVDSDDSQAADELRKDFLSHFPQEPASLPATEATQNADKFEVPQKDPALPAPAIAANEAFVDPAYDEGISYLLTIASAPETESFIVNKFSKSGAYTKDDVIATLEFIKAEGPTIGNSYNIYTALKEGVFYPFCRTNGRLNDNCSDFDREFHFTPNENIASKIKNKTGYK